MKHLAGLALAALVILVVLALAAGPSLAGGARAVSAQAGGPGGTDALAPEAQPEMTSAHYRLNWYVRGEGGGVKNSAHYRLGDTVGQPTAGPISSAHWRMRVGYWQQFLLRTFLPLLRRTAVLTVHAVTLVP